MTDLDPIDRRLLNLLQADAWLTNQALAERAHVSPATCLRRVRRLQETGVIERIVAIVAPQKLGNGIHVVLEVTLDVQTAEAMAAFEAHVAHEPAVQQCYRIGNAPDFIVVVYVADMPAYHAFAHRVLVAAANVRNVRSFFAVQRSKFEPAVPV
jgi:Lrp/AsnC family leucine-responsive transcriptional regulator